MLPELKNYQTKSVTLNLGHPVASDGNSGGIGQVVARQGQNRESVKIQNSPKL